jgi:hypothetical protein
MVNEWKMMSPENPKRPIVFWYFGSSPFFEGACKQQKIAFNGSIYSTNIRIRLCL